MFIARTTGLCNEQAWEAELFRYLPFGSVFFKKKKKSTLEVPDKAFKVKAYRCIFMSPLQKPTWLFFPQGWRWAYLIFTFFFLAYYVLTNEWPMAAACQHESSVTHSTCTTYRQARTQMCEKLKWQRLLRRKKVWKTEMTKAALTACLTVTNWNSC